MAEPVALSPHSDALGLTRRTVEQILAGSSKREGGSPPSLFRLSGDSGPIEGGSGGGPHVRVGLEEVDVLYLLGMRTGVAQHVEAVAYVRDVDQAVPDD